MTKKKENIDLDTNRFGLFMSEESFDTDIMFGREYLGSDVDFSIELYRINVIETKSHKLYGEARAKNKVYFAPVNLEGMLNIEDGNQQYYGGQEGITREDSGNLIFSVYLQELEEKNIDVKKGDIIKFNMSGKKPRYYEVDKADNVTDKTSQSIAGMKAYWKRIISIPVKEDVTPYLKEDKLV